MIIFDVGANDGKTFYNHIFDSRNKIFAFEPTRELINSIKTWSINFPNYFLIECAVGETEGIFDLNVAGHHDWGCTSLLEFNEGLDKTWPGRDDFFVSHVQKNTEVIRLDSFIKKNSDIVSIDYLHIDTQGTDLQVLKSLGDYINIVKEGCMESSMDASVSLYKNQHTNKDCYEFLEKNNFSITNVQPNDKFNNEVNIYFNNKI